jgi:Tol biopolymer transport system component
MHSERWRQIEAMYEAAMDREPDARAAFLAEACGDDEGLRREVESLLNLNSAPVLIDQPAWEVAADLLDNDAIVPPGTQLGPYRIEGVLGTGGMGHVYRARDTRLDRLVALKISKEEFTDRFEGEARAVAALNHANICTLHDVGPDYLVMELVEGPTLADRIKAGPVPLDEALSIARQIGDALEAAHEHGIVHRDLKPGNIKIKPDGTVKVLDFGLAKRALVGASANVEDSPTMSVATGAGMILGTAAYMSPEQARGHAVDKRADIWSFGVVLYEMLTGEQLFRGATVSDTLAAVLTREPDWNSVPSQPRRLLQYCLQKDPRRRLRDIADAWPLLDAEPVGTRNSRVPRVLAAALALVCVIALWALWRSERAIVRPLQPLVRLSVDLGSEVNLASRRGPAVILSPDGARIAYVSRERLYTRRLDQPNVVELAGTQGAHNPFFSPDGQWIAFFAERELKKISVDNGSIVKLCDAATTAILNGTWSEDGDILANLRFNGGFSRIPPSGGKPAPITPLAVDLPQVLPGGQAVLFTRGRFRLGQSEIGIMTLNGGERKTLVEQASMGRYLPSGHLLYHHAGDLFAVPFDLERLEMRGTPELVVSGVAFNATTGSAQFDYSRNGTLVYRSGGSEADQLSIEWMDANGKTQATPIPVGDHTRPALSPDGRHVAVAVRQKAGLDVWTYELQRGTPTRLTFDGNADAPLWTPDGRYLVFRSFREGGLFWIRSNGASRPQSLLRPQGPIQSGVAQFPGSFTPDGRRIAFMELYDQRKYHLWTAPIHSTGGELRAGTPEPLFHTPDKDERHPAFSPDGRWVAYTSDESGSFQVYVRPFPPHASGGKWQISNTGGWEPTWSAKTPHLFFRTEDNQVMVSRYSVRGDSFVADVPQQWSERRLADIGPVTNYDVSPDGKRILAVMEAAPTDQNRAHHVVFLLNFFDELRRRLPVSGR